MTGRVRNAARDAAPGGERERILAALGWEGDPRRRGALRRLLRDQTQRVYLHFYSVNHNKTSATDQTRRVLLRGARTLGEVPEACTFASWVFLQIRHAHHRSPECAEPWRALSEEDRCREESRDGAPLDSEEVAACRERHLEEHPGCRDLLLEYRAFLDNPADAALLSRSGWDAASGDLDLFVEAQFADEHPQAMGGRSCWRQLLASIRWTRSGLVAAAVALGAVLLALLLVSQWQNRPHREREPDRPSTATHPVASPAETTGTQPPLAEITGTSVTPRRSHLSFHWNRSGSADQYSLSIFTAKLELLHVVGGVEADSLELFLREAPALHSGGSYLFRVDGIRSGTEVATSGYVPFTIP